MGLGLSHSSALGDGRDGGGRGSHQPPAQPRLGSAAGPGHGVVTKAVLCGRSTGQKQTWG